MSQEFVAIEIKENRKITVTVEKSILLIFKSTTSLRFYRNREISAAYFLVISKDNKPFYSCLLSDPAYEWQRGCRLYGPRCFYHVNCVAVMLTSLHLHKKSKELCIKTKSPATSLPFIGRVTEPQL